MTNEEILKMIMDKEMKLKSCPCCGGSAKLLGQRTFYVECQKCFLATNKYARPQFAASAWNLRTKEPNFQYGGCENENQKNHKPVQGE